MPFTDILGKPDTHRGQGCQGLREELAAGWQRKGIAGREELFCTLTIGEITQLSKFSEFYTKKKKKMKTT